MRLKSSLWVMFALLLLSGAIFVYLWNSGVSTDADVFRDQGGWTCRQTFMNGSVRRVRLRVEQGSIDGVAGVLRVRDFLLGPRQSVDVDFRFPKSAVSGNRVVQFRSTWSWRAGEEEHAEQTELWLGPGK
jgi:hypothetical protein